MNKALIGLILIVGLVAGYFFYPSEVSEETSNNTNTPVNGLTTEELIQNVNLAIHPKFQNWILFRNGTYVIVEDTDVEEEIEKQGLAKLKEFGPFQKQGLGLQGSFKITTLHKATGWAVASKGYGMYIYVHPIEFEKVNPSDKEISLYGRRKSDLDADDPMILCVVSKGLIKRR